MSSHEPPKPGPSPGPRSWRVRIRVLAIALGVTLFVLNQVFMASFGLRDCFNGGPSESFRCQVPTVMVQLGVVLCLLTLMEIVVSALWMGLRSWRRKMTP